MGREFSLIHFVRDDRVWTGFASGGASVEALRTMLDTAQGRIKVKASGGIRDWQTAVNYLNQGCHRLGVGATAAVLDGERADGDY